MESLCKFELEEQGLFPLFPFPLAADPRQGPDGSLVKQVQYPSSSAGISKNHPHLVSPKQHLMLKTKSHLVLRMVDLRIGQDLLLQVIMLLKNVGTLDRPV